MITVTRRVHFAFDGKRKRANAGSSPQARVHAGRTPRVSKLMALAIRFDDLLRGGVVANQSELATLARVTQPRMTQILNLLHLAPDIQEDILFLPCVATGRDPITERDIRPVAAQRAWSVQRSMWQLLRA